LTELKGLLERLSQVKPKFIFMDDSAFYNGRWHDLRSKMITIAEAMAPIPQFKAIVAQPRSERALSVGGVPTIVSLGSFLSATRNYRKNIPFERVDFNAPLLIV
jgi:acetoacetyl-CoA synthetase